MKKLTDMFFESALKNPEKTAICCDKKSLTYKELASTVCKYSNFFITNGIKYKDHIGVPMNNSIESVILILSAAEIGAGIVPINPTLAPQTIKEHFEAGDVKHIIARKNFFDYLYKESAKENFDGIRICVDKETPETIPMFDYINMPDTRPETERISGDETLILTMTSGSTGSPKPINLTQSNKYIRSLAHIELYNITSEDNVLAATPLYHSLAERLVLMPLLIGGTSVLLPRFTPDLWIKCVKGQKVTFTISVSAQLNQIASLLSSPFMPEIDSLRCIVSSSALLETHVKNELIEKLNCDFHEMYGTSETSTVTSIKFRDSIDKKSSVGKPLPGVCLRIIDELDNELPNNKIGEIICKTDLICRGYYGKEELFNINLLNGYFKTGDLGYIDDDGYLYFSGRKKEIIITGGINVYPQDLENCIYSIEGVEECVAFSYPDERLGEIVAVLIVPKAKCELTKQQVRIKCAKNLADYQQPHKIFFSQELPKNTMGKIMKTNILEFIKLNGYEDI